MEASTIYSDLALEVANGYGAVDEKTHGVSVTEEWLAGKKIKVSQVVIHNEMGAKKMGRPVGHYFTVESEIIREGRLLGEETDSLLQAIAAILQSLFPKENEVKQILVAGLGNMDATPDAVGPLAVQRLEITRHLFDTRMKVSAIVPGVMGQTGMESGEIIKGIIEQTKPQVLIVVDALAARSVTRLGNTIQISDTGIWPGSGVGNYRNALMQENMGIPVLAIGAPTVVGAASLVCETIEALTVMVQKEMSDDFLKVFSNHLDEAERYGVIKELLEKKAMPMYITPKDVDSIVQRLGYLIGEAVNRVHE